MESDNGAALLLDEEAFCCYCCRELGLGLELGPWWQHSGASLSSQTARSDTRGFGTSEQTLPTYLGSECISPEHQGSAVQHQGGQRAGGIGGGRCPGQLCKAPQEQGKVSTTLFPNWPRAAHVGCREDAAQEESPQVQSFPQNVTRSYPVNLLRGVSGHLSLQALLQQSLSRAQNKLKKTTEKKNLFQKDRVSLWMMNCPKRVSWRK